MDYQDPNKWNILFKGGTIRRKMHVISERAANVIHFQRLHLMPQFTIITLKPSSC